MTSPGRNYHYSAQSSNYVRPQFARFCRIYSREFLRVTPPYWSLWRSNNRRAITVFWISEVPSPIKKNGASR